MGNIDSQSPLAVIGDTNKRKHRKELHKGKGALRGDEQKPLDVPIFYAHPKALDRPHKAAR